MKHKLIARILIVSMIISSISTMIGYAAPASVEVEETMYVNLDYYGDTEKVNVVKSVKMNGNSSYYDYGVYETITNMSNEVRPLVTDNQVVWEMPDDINQFHCQYGIKSEDVQIPWDFEVSYQLNGNPIHAEALRGASGLVELTIKATPNKKANLYYQNNMMLMVIIPVNYDTSYSVDAPGSQTQTVGGTSAVVFSALPGSEGNYVVRIGTDCFESTGIMMSMIPATMEDFEQIQDINDMKNTWRSSGDQLYDSMIQMMGSMESMHSDITTIQEGLDAAEAARQQWSAERESLLDSSGENLRQMTETIAQTEKMITYIHPLKEQATILYDSMSNLTDTMEDMRDTLEKLGNQLEEVESDLDSVSDSMEHLMDLNPDLLSEMEQVLSALEMLSSYVPMPLEEEDASYDSYDIPEIEELIGSLQGLKDTMEEFANESQQIMQSFVNLTVSGGDSISTSVEMIEDMRDMMDEMIILENSLAGYYPTMQSALSDTEHLLSLSTNAMNSGTDMMKKMQTLLKSSSIPMDESAQKSLNGTDKLLEKSLDSLDNLSDMRLAISQMKSVLDEQLDEIEADNNFLNIDPSAAKLSFTSEKNITPKTAQIVLRTAEISLDDDIEIADLETEKVATSPFARLWNVVVAIWNSTCVIFKNR